MMDSTIKININEVTFSPFSIIDDFGRVFFWGGRVFRAINKNNSAAAELLFSCGLISKLVEEGLFVDSCMTEYEIDGYDLVIEHKLADAPTYPYEWSFSMLKAAGIAALRLNRVASDFGFQTKDIHPYNILFFGTRPLFIDLGSFISISNESARYLNTFEEYLKCYVFPLKIWMSGDSYTARRYIQRWKLMTPAHAYIAYRLGGARGIIRGLIAKIWGASYRLQMIGQLLGGKPTPTSWKKYTPVIKVVEFFRFPLRLSRIDLLERKLSSYKRPVNNSQWGGYHGQLYLKNGDLMLSERMKKIVEIAQSFSPRTIVDIAGNQGVLSQVLAKIPNVNRVVCIDYDDEAIDKGFLRVAKSGEAMPNIHFAVINPFYPEVNKFEKSPHSRFKSDLVLALALTHHLVLTQGYSLDYILEVISGFSNDLVFVEFMPLGLYDSTNRVGGGAPEWYDEEWFKECFKKHFTLLEICHLEINRTLFIGRVRNT